MMKIKSIICLLFLMGIVGTLLAQEKGVHFEPNSENLSDIFAKARSQNKYVFIDCFATWCGPCKIMDKEVYSNDTVGQFMNEHFISVRLQMDKTAADNTEIKNWYYMAARLQQEYAISAYPSFLFFAGDGKPFHKIVGAQLPAENFLSSVKDALNPDKQYYNLLKNYQPDRYNATELKSLARLTSAYNDTLSGKIALDYLRRIPKKELYQPDNIDFIGAYRNNTNINRYFNTVIKHFQPDDFQNVSHQALLKALNEQIYVQQNVFKYLSSLRKADLLEKTNLMLISYFPMLVQVRDRYFDVAYLDSVKANALTGIKGFSKTLTDAVIDNRIGQPFIRQYDSTQTDPDWNLLKSMIREHTDPICAERNTYDIRYRFYKKELAKAVSQNSLLKFHWGKTMATILYHHIKDSLVNNIPNKQEYGAYANWLNDNAWTIFQYSTHDEELNKALFWVDKALSINGGNNAGNMDTKANILYKLGRKEEALQLEAQATRLRPNESDFTEACKRMQEGKPTWPVQQ